MPDKKLFEPINKYINKCEVRLDRYILPSLPTNRLQGKKEVIEEAKTSQEILIEKRIKKLQSCLKIKLCGANKSLKLKELEEQVGREFEIKAQQKKEKEESIVPIKKKGAKVEEEEVDPEELAREEAALAFQKTLNKYVAFTEDLVVQEPKLCVWLFMLEPQVENLLRMENREQIRHILDQNIKQEIPKGIGRLLITEMLYSVVRFCQKSEFSTEQLGTLLSIFYLTHQFFLSSLHRGPERTYKFFKNFMLPHCFECPPDSMKIFNYKESAAVATYFCCIYIKNIPLLRILTLPNFGLTLNYEKLPDPFEKTKKGKK